MTPSDDVSAGKYDADGAATGMSRSQLYALIATIAGLVAVAAGVLTPLLPVSTVTATIAGQSDMESARA
ncbi:MAG TPA: hypothetical protein PLC22_11500, partial [Gordonia sp. (in: high G+C Gram-positive bacteria)]|nr:hypothetical protein [Gordonia sp. (in: high G+C Gram-positive bacteria)]